MTPETFNRYLNNPSLLDSHSADELSMLVKEYPYFQVARMLLARNLLNLQSETYPYALRLAAAYAGDRSKLKTLIEGKLHAPEHATETESPAGIPAEVHEINTSDITIQEYTEEIGNNNATTEIVNEASLPHVLEAEVKELQKIEEGFGEKASGVTGKDETADQVDKTIPVTQEYKPVRQPEVSDNRRNPLIESIFARLSEVEITDSETEESIPEKGSDLIDVIDVKQAERNELVDRFIREEPRISAPKHDFFNPEDIARQSASLPEDIVSETLAIIYEQQGIYNSALKIYEKLMLLIPEKSSYFAARIKEIEKKRK